MSTPVALLPSTDTTQPSLADGSRIRFRQPVSDSGFIDAAWWPRSLDLTAELPPLLETVWTAGREITRITYNLAAWDPAPRRIVLEGRIIRLGGFTSGDRHTVRLTDAWRRERVDILVIAPETDPRLAEQIMSLASEADSPLRAGEILDEAARLRRPRPDLA